MLIKCHKCNEYVSSIAKFCPHCGAHLVKKVQCPECGAMSLWNAETCSNCGYPLIQGFRLLLRKKAAMASLFALFACVIAFVVGVCNESHELCIISLLIAHWIVPTGFIISFPHWRPVAAVPMALFMLGSVGYAIFFLCWSINRSVNNPYLPKDIVYTGISVAIVWTALSSIVLYWILRRVKSGNYSQT